jgi:hypothetical protein
MTEIKLNHSDFHNRANLLETCKSLSELDPAKDGLLFVQQIVSLGALLTLLDKDLDDSFSAIDQNARDPTYFLAAYFDTKNIVDALWVYKIIRSLTRYVLFIDRFYETGNNRYDWLAKRVRKSINELLQPQYDAQHLVYSIDYLIGQFSEFWKFERIVKSRLINNEAFSYAEIRHFNLSKSSDASLIYAKVLDAKLPNFNENVSLILHYNQALLDILDDWDDIEEDIELDMPNVFVMAAVGNISYRRIKGTRRDLVRETVLSGNKMSGEPLRRLVNDLHASAKSISVPINFAFVKSLSGHYADTLRKEISSANY